MLLSIIRSSNYLHELYSAYTLFFTSTSSTPYIFIVTTESLSFTHIFCPASTSFIPFLSIAHLHLFRFSLFQFGVPLSEWRWAGFSILVSLSVVASTLRGLPPFIFRSGNGSWLLFPLMTVHSIQPFWIFWVECSRVLHLVSKLVSGDISTHVNNHSETWRGVIDRNDVPDMNLSSVLLLD